MSTDDTTTMDGGATGRAAPMHFIRQIISDDVTAGKHGGRVVTRFPPEPNGYLHIGHAKAICIDFGMAREFGGRCHLRFDDTNPAKEDVEYVEAIRRDIRWLGFDWGEHEYAASNYFARLYECACELIRRDKAYVCTLGVEEFKEYRGVPTRPGKESPWRNRPVAESLDLFARMRAGEFPDGSYVLRGKIDMASPNLHLRDPAFYRIKRESHHATGDAWCLYPTYDFAHCLSDAFEGITHSMCTIEFEVHRPLYDWILEALEFKEPPHQYEFAPLNVSYTVVSKRRLQELVNLKLVDGWDDPRMPTLAGVRRRGFTPAAIRNFCEMVGVTKFTGLTDLGLLEFCVRQDLNLHAPRVMAVLNPLRVVIENYPEGGDELLDAVNNPEDPACGTRSVPFSRVLYIERDDFMEDPPKKFFRLAPGREVRLRYAYLITCTGVIRNPSTGAIEELRCTYDPATRGGNAPDGRKVKATIHWVSAAHALKAEARLIDRMYTVEEPLADKDRDFKEFLNPESMKVVEAWVEPSLAAAEPGSRFQFERLGYFCVDSRDSKPGHLVVNRTVTLRDSYGKLG